MTSQQTPRIVTPPQDFEQLKTNLEGIMGKSFAQLSQEANYPLPQSSIHGKGYGGTLIELCLGASAKSLPEPDFPQLDLELKTMPLDENFKTLESTYITVCNLFSPKFISFEDSVLFHKLHRMLWVFIKAPRTVPIGQRQVVGYQFYAPDDKTLQIIKNDYDEIMDYIITGRLAELTARVGTILQVRPKAADGSALLAHLDERSEPAYTRPRGFYLRRSFTQQLLDSFMKS